MIGTRSSSSSPAATNNWAEGSGEMANRANVAMALDLRLRRASLAAVRLPWRRSLRWPRNRRAVTANRYLPSIAASPPRMTRATGLRCQWIRANTNSVQVGGPNAGSRLTPKTMRKR